MALQQHSIRTQPLTVEERKYGVNMLDHLELCPRCMDAVPLRVKWTGDAFEWQCRKCEYYGHKDGSLTKVVEMKFPTKDDLDKYIIKPIMDG